MGGLNPPSLVRLQAGSNASQTRLARVRVPFLRFLLVDVAAVLLSVPISFGVAYVLADSVAMAVARVRELQLWVAGGALLVAAGWGLVLWRRHRRTRG